MHSAGLNCQIDIVQIQAAKDHAIPSQRQWVDVELPDYWEKRWRGYSGTVWYRLRWQQKCHAPNQMIALSINSINMAGQVYLNHHLLWTDQSLTEPLSRSWNTPRYWSFPQNYYRDGLNELSIKVVGVATQSPGIGKIQIGAPHAIHALYQDYLFRHRTLHFINLIITMVFGSLCFLIWLFRRQDSVFGWFAICCFLWMAFISNTLITHIPSWLTTLMNARLNLSIYCIYMTCFTIFTWRFANKAFKKTERILWVITVILICNLIGLPDHLYVFISIITFMSANLLFFINCIFYQSIAYRAKKRNIWVLAIILLSFIFIAAHDLYRLFSKSTDEIMLGALAAPLLALTISLALGHRLAENIRRIESFNHELAMKIQQVKSELEHSLQSKYRLELDNIRLQERLHLSHELHDGLGGSLVRSMVMVDKAEHFGKQNFMSILKLFRDDLRQIIDSGSSIHNKVPETPILWGASLRRRYIQIFEEINIESTWSLPENWLFVPNALESLSLLRVTEEALTNIVKHSQATQVSVDMQMPNQQELILTIIDNGIGFDLNDVEAGLHVGLHSMRMRVQRIAGELKIEHAMGQTMIQVHLKRQLT
ncbi:sensor histidine kinase [Acinetobacter larvae]|uniref:sensor histidine kinase n=1 Tax=Acinetobacter larvae TaxID=1789224 RepID=UPI000AD1A72D|nr:ATP-binding protein [Acinetobacter larvae]